MATKSTTKRGAIAIVTPTEQAKEIFNDIRSALRGSGDDGVKWELPPIDTKKPGGEPPIIVD